MPKFTKAIAALAAASALAASPLMAQDSSFQINDLDLSSKAGQEELEIRIERAVQRSCKQLAATGSRIPNRREFDSCRTEVRQLIKAQIAAKARKQSPAG